MILEKKVWFHFGVKVSKEKLKCEKVYRRHTIDDNTSFDYGPGGPNKITKQCLLVSLLVCVRECEKVSETLH